MNKNDDNPKTKLVTLEDGSTFTCPITGVCEPVERYKEKKQINKPLALIENQETEVANDFLKKIQDRSHVITDEFEAGLKAMATYPKSITMFGSARLPEDNVYYQKARNIASKICQEGYAVVTGGGPGIMEAGNRGTNETCGSAVGFNIELPFEQVINPYVTHGVNFHYFFTRKVSLSFSAEVYMYFPGGFGTMDELFEILTLIQTQKVDKSPVILVGKDFWEPLDAFIKQTLKII